MVSITLAVPEELKEEMEKHPELNWSEIARQAIKEKLDLLKKIDQLLSKSKLTQEDVDAFSRKIKKAATKKFLEAVSV